MFANVELVMRLVSWEPETWARSHPDSGRRPPTTCGANTLLRHKGERDWFLWIQLCGIWRLKQQKGLRLYREALAPGSTTVLRCLVSCRLFWCNLR